MNTNPQKIGPFTVIPLTPDSARSLATGPHGLEKVTRGQKTEGHQHSFVSFYVAIELVLTSDTVTHIIPQHSLVIVPEEVEHSWQPVSEEGFVGSVDTRHEQQVLMLA